MFDEITRLAPGDSAVNPQRLPLRLLWIASLITAVCATTERLFVSEVQHQHMGTPGLLS